MPPHSIARAVDLGKGMDVRRIWGMRVSAAAIAGALCAGGIMATAGPALADDDDPTAVGSSGAPAAAAAQDFVVANVRPTVDVVAVPAPEGAVGRVSATVVDPGDARLKARIDWGDGRSEKVSIRQLAAGLAHAYGDDGSYTVTVTVADGDGGVGAHAVPLDIASIDPVVALSVDHSLAFPGGEFVVVAAGGSAVARARASDAGSDDLSFSWSDGTSSTFYSDGAAPDPPASPGGRRGAAASASAEPTFATPGLSAVRLTVADDDEGSTDAAAAVLVTGTADRVYGPAWWLHELSGRGDAQLDPAITAAYLDVIAAGSEVFSEQVPLLTARDARAALLPPQDDVRAQARATLLWAWLQFASGAVGSEAHVTRGDGSSVRVRGLLAESEATIASAATGDEQLRAVIADLSRVRQAD